MVAETLDICCFYVNPISFNRYTAWEFLKTRWPEKTRAKAMGVGVAGVKQPTEGPIGRIGASQGLGEIRF
jgi:hypothetical protein